MDRMACVNLPEFPLQLLLQRNSNWKAHPAAVVDRDKAQGVILCVNDRARKLHILPGMRYAAGLSLSRHLRAGVVTQKEIGNTLKELVQGLRRFTSDVEPSKSEPGVFWLDASGLALLYPSLEKWAELIHADLTSAGFQCSVAVGFSRFGTYAAVKSTASSLVFHTPREERTFASEVPIEHLSFDPEHRDFLAKLGIHTLGRFLELPAQEVRLRLGREAYRLYRLAAGDLWSPIHPEHPLEPIRGEVLLDHPERDFARLMVLMEELFRSLIFSLAKRHESLLGLILRLVLDDRSEKTEILRPAAPTLDIPQILNLLYLRMEATELASGVVEINMELQGAPFDPKQYELFREQSRRDYEAANRALARLRAQFGEKTLLQARLKEAHLPEARFRWEPMAHLSPAKPRKILVPPLVRRFFRKPIRLPGVRREKGVRNLKGKVPDTFFSRESLGPYIVSGGWWVKQVHREYHFVKTAKREWLWIYYDRRRDAWFLQGKIQ